MTSAPHPRETFELIGHAAVERQLLAEIQADRLPGAYLLTGPPGIGKATLAYRLTRFLLAEKAGAPNDEAPGLFGDPIASPPANLFIPREHPAVSRMLAGAHADFLLLEPEWDDKKKAFKNEIPVESARRIGSFLSHTAGEGTWRVILIDPIDALNHHAANAILKWLEEPPAHAVFLLISNRPGALLPTIRSRCRLLPLEIPNEAEFAQILERSGVTLNAQERHFYHSFSAGAPGVAIALYADRLEHLYHDFLSVMRDSNANSFLTFAEKVTSGKDAPAWETLCRLVARFLSMAAKAVATPDEARFLSPLEAETILHVAHRKSLDYWLELWDKGTSLLSDAERLYLNRKHALFSVLLALSGQDTLKTAPG